MYDLGVRGVLLVYGLRFTVYDFGVRGLLFTVYGLQFTVERLKS